ncbi:hemolysin-III related-domain-containing protein [Vararia minispora EC-137]|uniref:Hemolysin-III related-domain-containing protein n=1 Tax=Vararia minispora EC-137 TaxID=1314806 RepID=A0ACB8QUB2_9AGAM|nr:hemolysin-III related-domain-containing protein [Vararia minispora EC-137]
MDPPIRLSAHQTVEKEAHQAQPNVHARSSHVLQKRTITWSELPEWMKDNEYIISGYRRELRSWLACFHSIFGYLHNETVNIHTHLYGTVLFLFLLSSFEATYFAGYESVTVLDRAVFAIFLLSAVFCLSSSTLFHTAHAHSQKASQYTKVSLKCNLLDYSAIVVLIVGSFFPCIYYAFYCERIYQVTYLLVMTTAGLSAACIVLSSQYSSKANRHARTYVFIALGLSGILPVSHALVSHGFHKLNVEMGFHWLLTSATLYIAGALLYANRIPECFAPGKFDYFFASHQIFHVAVVGGALCHYACILTAFDHWHRQEGICR